MVSIYIRNHLLETPIKAVRITVSSHHHLCEFIYHQGNKEHRALGDVFSLNQHEFKHPLLKTSSAPKIKGEYCIQYANFDELTSVGARLYATLIREGAAASQIRIQYTGTKQAPSRIWFSIDPNHAARESLSVRQFESFVASQNKSPSFHWFEGMLFDEVLDRQSLPKHIHADTLFEGSPLLSAGLMGHSLVECRYISDIIGLGLFARTTIPAQMPLFLYSGRMVLPTRKPLSNCYFRTGYNVFQRDIDSASAGCYSRFVNHAPKESIPGCLSANLNVVVDSHFGMSLIIYETLREIKKGEQLLISYGPRYWKHVKAALFPNTKKFVLLNSDGKTIKNSRVISRQTLHNMALSGMSKAQTKLFRRPLFFLAVSLMIAYCLNHFY